MNYHKALSNTLFGGFSRNEYYAISVYLMVYAQLESEPNDRRLRIWISDDEISFVRDFFNSDEGSTILSESVLEPLEYLNKKKELNKKRYSPENKKRISRESPENIQNVSRECQHDMTVHDMTVHDKKNTTYSNAPESFNFFASEIMNLWNTVFDNSTVAKIPKLTDRVKLKIYEVHKSAGIQDVLQFEEYFERIKNTKYYRDPEKGHFNFLMSPKVCENIQLGTADIIKQVNGIDYEYKWDEDKKKMRWLKV
jgi:hypothetical protein